MASKKIIGATIAIGLNKDETVDLLNKGLQKASEDLKATFEPKSFKILKLDNKDITFQIKDLENNIYTFHKKLNKLNKGFELGKDIKVNTESFEKTDAYISKIDKNVKNLGNRLKKLSTTGTIDNEGLNQLNNQYVELQTELKKVVDTSKQLSETDKSRILRTISDLDLEIKKVEQLQKIYNRFGELSDIKVEITGDGKNAESINAVTQALGLQQSQFKTATTIVDVSGQAWTRYNYQIKQGDGTVRKLSVAVNQNTKEMRANADVVQNTNIENATWIDRLKTKFKELTTYLSATTIIFTFFNELKRGISIITDVDSAMTELKKVTDETDATYKKFIKTASTLGVQVGKSIPDVIRATAEFSKLGYALDEATNLAEKALILTNIGDGIELSGSIDAITSTMKGFELDKTADDVEKNSKRIIDSINEVANKYAVDVKDISGAIQKMSAVMNQTGTTLEQTMGMFTAGNEIMRDESKVSNGLLTIAQRIRGISEEGEDLSKLQPTLEKQFNQMGLTLLDQNGELKSTYEILDDLNSVWDNQSSQMKQYIGELIAGKRQISVLYSTLQNWEQAQNATTTALNSSGSAMKENARYMDSIQGKVEQLKDSVQVMWLNTIQSETVKSFVDFGNILIKMVDSVGLSNVALGGLFLTLAKFPETGFSQFLLGVSGSIKNLGTDILSFILKRKASTVTTNEETASIDANILSKNAETTATIAGTQATISNVTATNALSLAKGELANATKIVASAEMALSAEQIANTATATANTASQLALGAGAKTASVGVGLLGTALNLLPLVAVVGVIGLLVKGIDALIVTTKEQKEKVEELQTEYDNSVNSLNSINSELEAQLKLISELESKDSLTFIEKQQLNDLKEATRELQLQADIERKKQDKLNRELAIESAELINKQYDVKNAYLDKVNEYAKTADNDLNNDYLISDEKNISAMVAGYRQFVKLKEEAFNKGDTDAEDRYIWQLQSIKDNLDATVDSLQQNKTKMQDYYNSIKLIEDSGGRLTKEQIEVKEAYEQTASAIELIYKELEPDKWKEMSFNNVFDLESMQKTKQELLELAQNGELTLETFNDYEDVLVKTGLSAVDLSEQFYALAKASKKVITPTPIISYKEILDDVTKKVETVTKAQYELAKSGYLDYNTVSDLLEIYPNLQTELSLTEEGYIVSNTALQNLIESEKDQYELGVNNAIKAGENVLNAEILKQQGYDGTAESLKRILLAQIALARVEALNQRNEYAKAGIGMGGLRDFKPYKDAQRHVDELQLAYDNLANAETNLNNVNKVTAQVQKSVIESLTDKDKKLQEFSEAIDWTTEALQKLENELKSLNDQLSNTSSLEAQARIYDKLISKQKEYINALKQAQRVEQTAYDNALSKLSKSDQEKVKNGSYTIEQFSGQAKSGETSAQEKRYNNIQEALKAKGILDDVNQKLEQAGYSLKDINKAYSELVISIADKSWDNAQKKVEKLNQDLDLLNAQLDNTDSYDKRNKKLQEILDKEGEIVQQYKDAVAQNQADALAIFGSKNTTGLKNSKGEQVTEGQLISTKGINDPEQLAWIKQYNALIREYRVNLKQLNIEEEKYAGKKKQTNEEIYENNKKRYEDELSIIENNMQDVENAIDEAKSLGGQATKEQYQELINLSKQEVANYEKQKSLAEEQLKNVGANSERYYELQKEIQSCEDAISDAEQAQNKWNRAIIELPISDIEKANKKLQETVDILNKQKDDYDKVISAVTDAVDEQIESIQENQEAVEDNYDSQIKLIKEKIDALQEENDARKKQMDLEKAQYDAERARNQKTKMVYREGQGFVYESDQQAIREAQNTLDKLTFDAVIDGKEREIKVLETEKEKAIESFQEQIKYLNDIKKQWEDIADAYERMANVNLANTILGYGWQDKILNGDSASLDYIKSQYISTEGQISDLEAKIKANEAEIQAIKELADAWEESQLKIKEQKDLIKQTVTDNKEESEALDKMQKATTAYATEWTTAKGTIYEAQTGINTDHATARDTELGIIEARTKNLKGFASEVSGIAGEIGGYLTTILADLASAKSANTEMARIATGSGTITVAKNVPIKNATKQHSGMELGYAGDYTKSNDAFRYIALDELRPDEVMKVVKVDEAILTPKQQNNAVSNIVNGYKAGAQSAISKIIPQSLATQPVFTVGEIHLHEVNDVNGLANAIITDFLPLMNQKLHR